MPCESGPQDRAPRRAQDRAPRRAQCMPVRARVDTCTPEPVCIPAHPCGTNTGTAQRPGLCQSPAGRSQPSVSCNTDFRGRQTGNTSRGQFLSRVPTGGRPCRMRPAQGSLRAPGHVRKRLVPLDLGTSRVRGRVAVPGQHLAEGMAGCTVFPDRAGAPEPRLPQQLAPGSQATAAAPHFTLQAPWGRSPRVHLVPSNLSSAAFPARAGRRPLSAGGVPTCPGPCLCEAPAWGAASSPCLSARPPKPQVPFILWALPVIDGHNHKQQ